MRQDDVRKDQPEGAGPPAGSGGSEGTADGPDPARAWSRGLVRRGRRVSTMSRRDCSGAARAARAGIVGERLDATHRVLDRPQRGSGRVGWPSQPIVNRSGTISMNRLQCAPSARRSGWPWSSPFAVLLHGLCRQVLDAARHRRAECGPRGLRGGQHRSGHDPLQELREARPTNQFCIYNLGVIAQTAGTHRRGRERLPPGAAPRSEVPLADVQPRDHPRCGGFPQEAIDLYRQFIHLRSDIASAHLNLSQLLSQIGDTAGAARELATAIQLDPTITRPVASSGPANPTPAPSVSASP